MNSICVIISGATGGIGREISFLCLSSNKIEKCVLLYKDETKYQYIFGNIKSSKITKCFYDMEVDYNNLFLMQNEVLKGCREVRLILSAFTIKPLKNIANLEMEEVINNINVNVISQINLINFVIKIAKKQDLKVSIVNLNSGAAYKALNGWALYSGAKAYLNMYLKTLVEEEKVNVVSYEPGVVDTNMQKDIRETDKSIFDQVNIFIDYYKENKLIEPKQVATDIFERYIIAWKANNFEEGFNNK